MSNLVKIRLFGDLGKSVGESWDLSVDSVKEGISAINILTNNSFSDYFYKQNKLYAKYQILINGRDFYSPEKEINENNAYLVNQSELVMKKKDLKTIDIVPVIESADPVSLIVGAVNSTIAGGPYRTYQLVIEAHDNQGNTSAGNRVGTSNENGWAAYPYGYDIIAISNPRPTGIEMSNNFATTNYYTGGTYYTLITGASDSKYQISGVAGLIGAGRFSGSGFFT